MDDGNFGSSQEHIWVFLSLSPHSKGDTPAIRATFHNAVRTACRKDNML